MHLRPAVLLLLAIVAAAPARAEDRDLLVTTGTEVMMLPEFLMRPIFEHSKPGAVVLAGADARWIRGGSEWSAGIGGGTILSPDGVWTVKNGQLDELGGWYQEMDMDVLLLWAGGEWGTPLGRGVSLRYGAQLGMAVLLGEIYATELIPGCDGPPGGVWPLALGDPTSGVLQSPGDAPPRRPPGPPLRGPLRGAGAARRGASGSALRRPASGLESRPPALTSRVDNALHHIGFDMVRAPC